MKKRMVRKHHAASSKTHRKAPASKQQPARGFQSEGGPVDYAGDMDDQNRQSGKSREMKMEDDTTIDQASEERK